MSFKKNLISFTQRSCVGIVFATIGLTTNASAGNFLFRLDGISPDSSTLCDDFAFSEAQRLTIFVQENLGQSINITDARCVANDGHGPFARWDIEISYSADKAIPTIATNEAFGLSRPTFATKDSCLATIEAEKEMFTRQTQLPVFIAYCVVPSYSSNAWEINVTGFGNPEIRPYSTWSNIFGTILGHTRESFTTMMAKEFAKFGYEVAQLSVEGAMSHQNLAIRYYGKSLIRLEEVNIAKFQTPSECSQLVNQTQSVLNAADLRSFGVYCIRDPLIRAGATLVTMSQTPTSMLIISPETIYETLDSCTAAKQSVVDHYITNLKRDVKAGYCSFETDDKKFKVVMLEKKKA